MVTDAQIAAYVELRANSKEYQYEDVELLWANDWYDGPLSGIAKLDGELVWFDWFEGWGADRRYSLSELSLKQKQEEIKREYIHRQLYNHDWRLTKEDSIDDLVAEYNVEIGEIPTKENYEKQWNDDDNEHDDFLTYGYRQNKVVGWFKL